MGNFKKFNKQRGRGGGGSQSQSQRSGSGFHNRGRGGGKFGGGNQHRQAFEKFENGGKIQKHGKSFQKKPSGDFVTSGGRGYHNGGNKYGKGSRGDKMEQSPLFSPEKLIENGLNLPQAKQQKMDANVKDLTPKKTLLKLNAECDDAYEKESDENESFEDEEDDIEDDEEEISGDESDKQKHEKLVGGKIKNKNGTEHAVQFSQNQQKANKEKIKLKAEPTPKCQLNFDSEDEKDEDDDEVESLGDDGSENEDEEPTNQKVQKKDNPLLTVKKEVGIAQTTQAQQNVKEKVKPIQKKEKTTEEKKGAAAVPTSKPQLKFEDDEDDDEESIEDEDVSMDDEEEDEMDDEEEDIDEEDENVEENKEDKTITKITNVAKQNSLIVANQKLINEAGKTSNEPQLEKGDGKKVKSGADINGVQNEKQKQGAQKRKATDTSDDAEKSEKGTTSAKIPRILEADEMEKIIIEEERRRVERNRISLFLKLPLMLNKGDKSSSLESDLKKLHSDIVGVNLVGRSAWLLFSSENAATKAYGELKNETFKGQPLIVDFCGEKAKLNKFLPKPASKLPINPLDLCVTSLPHGVTEANLREIFPAVKQIKFLKKPPHKKKTAFMTFNAEDDARKAFEKGRSVKMSGLPISVFYGRLH